MRRRIAGTNICDTSLLATDYLNHFNEVVMLIDMIPDMPECLDDVREWRPKSYTQHFADCGLPEADLAIAAYELSPEGYRLPLENTVDNLNRLVDASLERIASAVESGDQDGLADVSARASRNMQRLVEAASVSCDASLERIASAVESGDQDGLADVSARASRNMQRLVEAASAIINGATSTIDQTEIDNMFER